MRGVLIVLLAAFGLLLSACGGGGTGGGGTAIETNTLSASRSNVTFQSAQYGAPAQQFVSVTFGGDAEQLVLGTLPGETLPRWLDVELVGAGNRRGNLIIQISDSNLEPGEYQTTIRLLTSNLAETRVFNTADIQITYTVAPYVPITIDVAELNIETTPRQAPFTQSITLMGEGIIWENRALSGFSISPRNGIIPAEGQVVDITIDPSRLDFDRPPSTISFNEVGAPVSTELPVVFNLVDGIVIDPSSLAFMANSGSTATQNQSITIDDFDITTEAQINWSATSDQSWLSVDPNGVIDTIAAIPSQATVTMNPTGLAVGVYDATITFTNDVSTQVVELSVNLVIAQQNIVTSRSGVALSSQSKLQETLTVSDGTGLDVPWAATSNASWLSVTASGAAGEPLILTADPAGLSNNSLSEAIVTVTSPLSNITTSKTINVGFWNSDAAPSDVTIPNIVPLGDNSFPEISLVADPIRPYVYILAGTQGLLNSNIFDYSYELTTLNVYTGEQIGPTLRPQTTERSSLVISDDGQSLYVFSSSSIGLDTQYARYDLNNLGNPTQLNIDGVRATGAQYARVNGVAYLIAQTGELIDPDTGSIEASVLSELGFSTRGVSQNGLICSRISPTEVACYELFGTGVAGTDIAASLRNVTTVPEQLGSITTSPDGSAFYGYTGGTLYAYDDNGMELFNIPGDSIFLVADDGTIIGVGFDENDPRAIATLAGIYNPDGSLISTLTIPEFTGFLPRVIQSSDGARLIYLFEDGLVDNSIYLTDRP